jgi:NAD(P)H-dependent FMN reductase
MTRIAIIIGSTRPGRRADTVARWIHDIACVREDATFDLVDLVDYPLPHLDEPVPAAMGPDYTHAHTRAWAKVIDSYDGYIFITPEYNHSTTAVLKNAIDYLYTEWHNKAAGFVSYGLNGGTRAVEHLRLIMAELQIADVRAQVALSLATDFHGDALIPGAHQLTTVTTMLDQTVAWSRALESLRPAHIAALESAGHSTVTAASPGAPAMADRQQHHHRVVS